MVIFCPFLEVGGGGSNSPQWARPSSFTRFLDHTQRRITVGRTPLYEWSARRRDLYLTTHYTRKTNIDITAGIRTHSLSRRAAAHLYLRARGYWDRQINVCPRCILGAKKRWLLLQAQKTDCMLIAHIFKFRPCWWTTKPSTQIISHKKRLLHLPIMSQSDINSRISGDVA